MWGKTYAALGARRLGLFVVDASAGAGGDCRLDRGVAVLKLDLCDGCRLNCPVAAAAQPAKKDLRRLG